MSIKITDVNLMFDTKGGVKLIADAIPNQKENAMLMVDKAKQFFTNKKNVVVIDIDRQKEIRSIKINNYCWILCEEIAKVTGITKIDVYKKQIREVGVVEFRSFETRESADEFLSWWNELGTGFFADELLTYTGDDVQMHAYRGSHTYKTPEMWRLVKSVQDEAKELGIETRTPDEIERMMSLYDEGRKKIEKHTTGL